MKRWLAVGMASSVLAAGCYAPENDTPTPSATVELHSLEPVSQRAGRLVLDMSVMPSVLPEMVTEQMLSVVELRPRVTVRKIYNSGKLADSERPHIVFKGSAINLGNGDFLTAEHLFGGNTSSTYAGLPCADGVVYKTTTHTSGGSTRITSSSSKGLETSNAADDLAIAHIGQTPGAKNSFTRDLPAAKLPELTTVANGDAVFFVNYQLNDKDLGRSPEDHTPPAAFGGFVLKQVNTSNNDIVVISGMKAYDSEGDTNLHPGGSGGPVFSQSGELVGISVASGGFLSGPEVEAEFDIAIHNERPGSKYQIEFVEPANAAVVAKLKEPLRSNSQYC